MGKKWTINFKIGNNTASVKNGRAMYTLLFHILNGRDPFQKGKAQQTIEIFASHFPYLEHQSLFSNPIYLNQLSKKHFQ
jgi:hypothetical protein